ncbi:HAD-IA family hydrolase [Halomonas binhaiensis]|uniref:HAD-IA family hydrolase n=1 Tax=Halomonas binhaiensis TaxID=2562282 RepID=A0A5C1NLB1_9GAMM|nr:HAD-IA family hydrolase [Halomonas binhaiensis]QEM83393.1 HAD-IA family hydrolase [Halomonas binhaiensis]
MPEPIAPLCLLFDSDGTLVDSEILLAEVMAETLPPFGLPFSATQYMEEFRGIRFLDIVQTLEKRFTLLEEAQRGRLEQNMRERMAERMIAELEPIAGMPQALDQLRTFPKAVASNGPLAKIRCAMQASGLAEHFGEYLFSAYELKVWKPDPGLYLAAAEAMGYSPERCVVIDDAAVGVQAGLDAGMQVVHLNHFPDTESTPSGAISITHASQLVGVINDIATSVVPCQLSPQ